MHESKCDTTAMPAATEVSFPYALGITTVLSPKGIASEQSAQINNVLSIGINCVAKTKARGNIISLTKETA